MVCDCAVVIRYFIRTSIYTELGAPLRPVASSLSQLTISMMNWVRNAVAGILRNLAFLLTTVAELIDVKDIGLGGETSVETTAESSGEEETEEESEEETGSSGYSSVDTGLLQRSRKDTILSSDSGIDSYEIPDFPTGRDEETGLDFINLEEVSYHNVMEDAWMVVYDKVYEMTEYLECNRHPGGQDVILEYLGYDATLAFRGVGHSKPAMKMLEKYCIGILPHDERLNFSSHL